jgi:hypothetical protein
MNLLPPDYNGTYFKYEEIDVYYNMSQNFYKIEIYDSKDNLIDYQSDNYKLAYKTLPERTSKINTNSVKIIMDSLPNLDFKQFIRYIYNVKEGWFKIKIIV